MSDYERKIPNVEGKSLEHWVCDLISQDHMVRKQATKVIFMYFVDGQPLYSKIAQIFAQEHFSAVPFLRSLIQHYKKSHKDDNAPEYSLVSGMIIENAKVVELIPELMLLLEDETSGMRTQRIAAVALGNMKQDASRVFHTFFDIACDAPRNLSKSLADIVGNDEDKIDFLVERLYSNNKKQLIMAAKTLKHLGKNAQKATSALKEVIRNRSQEAKCWAIRALPEITENDPEFEQMLIDILNNDKYQGSLKSTAIEALAKVSQNSGMVIPILLDAIDDENYDFLTYEGSVESAVTLMQKFIHDLDEVPFKIVEMIGHEYHFEEMEDQERILSFIDSMGSKAKNAVPQLRHLVEKTDYWDADRVHQIIDNITVKNK